ncbi:MAG TPA: hypothetical protein VG815_04985 [Chloroflexota bacterium]|nr:hypothetical protein [Chloroflexota bacterium]
MATDDGVAVCERTTSGFRLLSHSLTGHAVTSVVAREGVILAGTRDGIYRSNDAGLTWEAADEGLGIRLVRWMAFHPDISDREFAGTEPAGVFVSHDGGGSWRSCPEVVEMRDRGKWFLPYSPEAGCVRGFAFSGDRVYAAVEVGGVLRSDDRGETWRLVPGASGRGILDAVSAPFVHSDVHSIAVPPSHPDHVLAATAEGLYLSTDGGVNWTVTQAGSYCRAVWVDPADAGRIVLGPAASVVRKNGRIEETHDGGRTWRSASAGLDLPWPDTMVERFTQVGPDLFAVTNDGQLYVSPATGRMTWTRVLAGEVESIAAVAAIR